MKYTVVLSQSVPNEVRADLAERLTSRFGLSPDQAQKLASRKPGRLLKPTTQARAEALLAVYSSMGIQAKLEEVAEDAAEPVAAAAATTPAVSATPVAAAAPTVTAPAAQPAMPSASVWASVTPVAPAPGPAAAEATEAPAPQRVTISTTPTIERTFVEVPTDTPEPAGAERRISLRQRVLLTTLLPLLAAGLLSLLISTITFPSAQRQVMREGARALAASVATGVNVDNVNEIEFQIRTLLQQPSVGFVQVVTADGLPFFLSKNEDIDPFLGERVNEWLEKHPDASAFTYTDRPAQRYEEQIQQLKDSGVTGEALKTLESKLESASNEPTVTTNYEIQNVGVYEKNGARSIGESGGEGKDKPLFTVAVGVISDKSVAVTRQSIITQVLLTLLILGVAGFFAARTSRRIVQPIETLVAAADKISLGQLDTPVAAERNDEIGDLARALERMRLSLQAAMERLRKRRNRG